MVKSTIAPSLAEHKSLKAKLNTRTKRLLKQAETIEKAIADPKKEKQLDVALEAVADGKELTEVLTPELAAALKAKVKAVLAGRLLQLYKPYPKQVEFHAAGAHHRERLLMASNQCITIDTLIDTASGKRSVRELIETNQPFEILAWDGEKPVTASASVPFRKAGEHPCFRLTMADGQWVECSVNHRILTVHGWLPVSSVFLAAHKDAQSLLPTNSDACRSIRAVSVLSSVERPLNYQGDYSAGFHQYGEQLHVSEAGDLTWLPLLSDVPQYIHPECNSGDRQPEYTNTECLYHPQEFSHHSNLDDLQARADQFFGSEIPFSCRDEQSHKFLLQELEQQLFGSSFDLQSLNEPTHVYPLNVQLSPCIIPSIANNNIISIQFIGSHIIYDIEVKQWCNYIAGGLIHHNSGKSYCGAAEMAMHLLGEYPEWWPGKRFQEPVAAWAIGHTALVCRDTLQRLLFGRTGQIGTGFIPSSAILRTSNARGIADAIDTAVIRHSSGGISNITFKSFEQGVSKLMGETIDVVWLDEECPAEIYSEVLTRTNARADAVVFTTFTPLNGISEVVRQFYPVCTTDDRHITRMTLEDAGHYTPEQIAKIIASYPEHERDARTKGLPMLGSGQVFPIPESRISCQPFEVPNFWQQIIGVDFGITHPFAAVKCAYDADNDTIYVTACHRVKNEIPVLHAATIKGWGGDSIPIAWPGDGSQMQKNDGVPLMESYRAQGLNMLHERAQFEGGSVSVEAGLNEMRQRFETGRLKIFSNCAEIFEELRTYYRKNGAVIKENEDIICALRYAVVMMRYAEVPKASKKWGSGSIRRNIPRV
jgi:phage terminase large subunit-like protein